MSAYKLSNLIRARFPVIYITTFEEDRVTKYIKSVVTDVKQVKFAREVLHGHKLTDFTTQQPQRL